MFVCVCLFVSLCVYLALCRDHYPPYSDENMNMLKLWGHLAALHKGKRFSQKLQHLYTLLHTPVHTSAAANIHTQTEDHGNTMVCVCVYVWLCLCVCLYSVDSVAILHTP